MAKTQTFGDKTKKKADTRVNVKVIRAFRSDKGTMRFVEKFVMVNDAADIDKIKL